MAKNAQEESQTAGSGSNAELGIAMLDTPFTFGLQSRQIAIIEEMLDGGKAWQEIGRAIGWHPDTAKEYYRRLPSPERKG
jgi:hypothetical protein